MDQILDLLKEEQWEIFLECSCGSMANIGLSSMHGSFLAVVAGYILKF
jgi:hypothetical protein